MGEEDVGVAFPAHPQCGAGSDRDDPDLDSRLFGEAREQGIEQARIANTRRRCEDQ